MTNCRSGWRAASTGPPFVRTAEPLEQGDAKGTGVGSARRQRNGVDLVLEDVVLGVHRGVTGPRLERHKRGVVGGRPHADVLKALKVDLDAVARLATAQRERGARSIGEHDGVVIEAAVRNGQHVRVIGSPGDKDDKGIHES